MVGGVVVGAAERTDNGFKWHYGMFVKAAPSDILQGCASEEKINEMVWKPFATVSLSIS